MGKPALKTTTSKNTSLVTLLLALGLVSCATSAAKKTLKEPKARAVVNAEQLLRRVPAKAEAVTIVPRAKRLDVATRVVKRLLAPTAHGRRFAERFTPPNLERLKKYVDPEAAMVLAKVGELWTLYFGVRPRVTVPTLVPGGLRCVVEGPMGRCAAIMEESARPWPTSAPTTQSATAWSWLGAPARSALDHAALIFAYPNNALALSLRRGTLEVTLDATMSWGKHLYAVTDKRRLLSLADPKESLISGWLPLKRWAEMYAKLQRTMRETYDKLEQTSQMMKRTLSEELAKLPPGPQSAKRRQELEKMLETFDKAKRRPQMGVFDTMISLLRSFTGELLITERGGKPVIVLGTREGKADALLDRLPTFWPKLRKQRPMVSPLTPLKGRRGYSFSIMGPGLGFRANIVASKLGLIIASDAIPEPASWKTPGVRTFHPKKTWAAHLLGGALEPSVLQRMPEWSAPGTALCRALLEQLRSMDLALSFDARGRLQLKASLALLELTPQKAQKLTAKLKAKYAPHALAEERRRIAQSPVRQRPGAAARQGGPRDRLLPALAAFFAGKAIQVLLTAQPKGKPPLAR